MVARYWSARARRDTASTYSQHFNEHVLPVLQKIDGYVTATVLQRQIGHSIEIVVLTYWKSLEAIRGFAGDDLSSPSWRITPARCSPTTTAASGTTTCS